MGCSNLSTSCYLSTVEGAGSQLFSRHSSNSTTTTSFVHFSTSALQMEVRTRYSLLINLYCTMHRLKSARVTDKRVRVMNEIISGMRLIKMYAWEWAFHEYVKKIRKLAIK